MFLKWLSSSDKWMFCLSCEVLRDEHKHWRDNTSSTNQKACLPLRREYLSTLAEVMSSILLCERKTSCTHEVCVPISEVWKPKKKWKKETLWKPAKCSTAYFEKTRTKCSTYWGRLIVLCWKDGWQTPCQFIPKHLKTEKLNLSDCFSWWMD